MLESSILLNVFTWFVGLLLGVVGFFLVRFLHRQDSNWSEMHGKIDAILKQVSLTNGRVGILEEWKRNNEKSEDSIHAGIFKSIDAIWERFNHFKE